MILESYNTDDGDDNDTDFLQKGAIQNWHSLPVLELILYICTFTFFDFASFDALVHSPLEALAVTTHLNTS